MKHILTEFSVRLHKNCEDRRLGPETKGFSSDTVRIRTAFCYEQQSDNVSCRVQFNHDFNKPRLSLNYEIKLMGFIGLFS